MNLKRLVVIGIAAAALAGGSRNLSAQDNAANPPGPGGNAAGGQQRQRGNWDPAQMQQRMMERIQEQLGFTNSAEWDAVMPLVQKVMDARREVGFGGMGRMFSGGRTRNGAGGEPPNRGGGLFGQTSPEQEALQKAIDDNAPSAQIKDLLAKYKAVQKTKQAKLEAAQADLKAVLTIKQEAKACLLGLVN